MAEEKAYRMPKKDRIVIGAYMPVCTAAAGLDASEVAKISWVSNASISIIDYEDGRFIPVSINNSDHLGDLITVFQANV